MLFIEFRFFLFLALFLALYWKIPSNRYRKALLVFASYCFYAAWDWRFLSLILVSTIVDYFVGIFMSERPTKSAR
jgi:alginate O-acetyltransferase complex protein AlgI